MARILVIDDEPLVRSSIRRSLEIQGHEVVDVPSPTEALDLLAAQSEFDAIITDLDMPSMDGRAFAALAETRHGPLTILLVTGNVLAARTVLHRELPVLLKPFTPLELLDRLDELLVEPRSAVANGEPEN